MKTIKERTVSIPHQRNLVMENIQTRRVTFNVHEKSSGAVLYTHDRLDACQEWRRRQDDSHELACGHQWSKVGT